MKTINNMKKFFLAAALTFASAMGYAQFSGGDGSKANPYQLRTAADDSKFAEYVLHHGDTATQTNWTNGKFFQVESPEHAARLERGAIDRRNANSVGQKVWMPQSKVRYCTGELIPQWVKNKYYTIMQVGTKRFPDGLLFKEIYSWVDGVSMMDSTYTFQGTILIKPFASSSTSTKVTYIKGEDRIVDIISRLDTIEQKIDTIDKKLDTIEQKIDNISGVKLVPGRTQDSIPTKFLGFHRFGIGARGGFASHMQDAKELGNWKVGWMAALDLEYAYYFTKKKLQNPWLGIKTGLSLTFSRNPLQSDVNNEYSVTDDDGAGMEYTITADDVRERDGQLSLEIPLMFSLLHKGLFFNVGPKFVIPVYAPYKQKIDNVNIIARYPEYGGYDIPNEVITGKPTPSILETDGKWDRSKFCIFLSADIGYEWELKSGYLGLGVYADYSVFDTFKDNTGDKPSLISVTTPAQETPAVVSALSATDTYATGIGYFDCGVKLIYNFQFDKKRKK